MDSFGLDFGSNDILDLGSLGMWGGSTPVGSSPSGTGLPFSVGTPTGVPSLGDDSFPSLQGGNEDFIFPDSPKSNAMEGQSSKEGDTHASSSTTQTSSSSTHVNISKNSNTKQLTSNASSESITIQTSGKDTISGSQFDSSNSQSTKSEKEDRENEENEENEDDEDEDFNASSYFGDDFDQDSSTASQLKRSESVNTQENAEALHELNENSRRNSNTSSDHSLSNLSSPKDHTSTREFGKATSNYDNSNAHGSLSQREFTEEAKRDSMMTSDEAFDNNSMLHSTNSMGLAMSLPNDHGGLHPLTPNRSLPQTSNGGSTTSVSSAARPHIEAVSMSMSSNHSTLNHQANMARYPQSGPMMMMSQGQVPSAMGGSQGYPGPGYSHSIPMPSPGPPQSVPPSQYMQAPPSFRPPSASSYDEDLMRMKSMMLQHSDLIPPPMEVLRISMSQSQPNQQNVLGGTYMPQRSVGPSPGVRTNPSYPQYPSGNPGMMIQQTTPTNAVDRAQLMQRRMPRTPSNTSLLDASPPWQSETDLPLRRKMIGKIVSLLQARKPDAPPEWIRRLPDMARRLEDSLYRTAKNRDEYGDFGTLKTRLQHLAVTMGARAQHKAGTTRPSASAPAGSGMMHPGNTPVNSLSMAGNVSSSGHMLTGMSPYNNIAGRMSQQQLLQQQHMTQMQNSQMRQQMTPQQLQQLQVAQMRRSRQYQQQMQQQHAQNIQRQAPYQHTTQQMQHPQMQRQAPLRQPSAGAPNVNQRASSQSYMQQSQESASAGQTPMQYRNTNSMPSGISNRSNEMNFGETSEFLNLELSQSFLSADDLGSEHSNSEVGHKRSLTHAQQQMAAAANAAAFKRTKVSGTSDQRGMSPLSSSSPSGNQLQKSVQSNSNKTPPMSAVNAK